MSQAPTILDPWRLVWGQPYIDSRTLATAIEQDLKRDTRARLPHPAPGPRRRGGDSIVLGVAGSSHKWLATSPVGQQDPRDPG